MLFLAVAVVLLAVLTLVGAVKVANALREGARIVSEGLNGLWTGTPSDTKYVPLDEVLAAHHLATGTSSELVLDNEDIEELEERELY